MSNHKDQAQDQFRGAGSEAAQSLLRENNHTDQAQDQFRGAGSEDAQSLLRAMTDIDDRFLMEAMDDSENAAPVSGNEPAESTVSDRIHEDEENSADDISKNSGKRNGKLRRYSAWALTAAACLTVIIVGRFVSVNRVRTDTSQAVVMSEAADEELAGEAAADKAAADEEAADKAVVNEAAAVEEAAGEAAADKAAAVEEAAGEAVEKSPVQEAAEDIAVSNLRADNDLDAAGAGAAVTMANPFTDYQTLEEAQQAVGFDISLPDAYEPYENLIYRGMKGTMIEVIYLDGGRQEGYRIRKGRNMEEDISGDYNEYPAEDTLTLDDIRINVRGDMAGQWKCVTWTQRDGGDVYSFAIDADRRTFTSDEILEMAGTMSGKDGNLP